MAYSATMKQAIGAVRAQLASAGFGMADSRFAHHGVHRVDPHAPLLLVACSGGRDSLALAAVTHTVASAWGMRCGAAIVDHGMQPGSALVAQRAAAQCERLGLAPVLVRTVHVRVGGEGAEAAARDARYEALAAAARETDTAAVLLGHTRDDQAEGVLIGLIRTGGVDAVAGMPAQQTVHGVRFVRPLLTVSRAQTTAICTDLGIEWWDDPTNGDAFAPDEPLPADYPLRSRVRHTLLPFLNEFAGRDMTERLAHGARVARRDLEWLDACTDRVFTECVQLEPGGDPCEARIDATRLAAQPQALRFRVIARVLTICAPGSGAAHVDAVEALVSQWHGQGPVQLPSKHTANRKKHVIRVCEDVTHANRRHSRQD